MLREFPKPIQTLQLLAPNSLGSNLKKQKPSNETNENRPKQTLKYRNREKNNKKTSYINIGHLEHRASSFSIVSIAAQIRENKTISGK